MSIRRLALAATIPALALACSSSSSGPSQPGSTEKNPFLENQAPSGKADTAYTNPDGIEVVEVRVRRDNRRELDARIRALG